MDMDILDRYLYEQDKQEELSISNPEPIQEKPERIITLEKEVEACNKEYNRLVEKKRNNKNRTIQRKLIGEIMVAQLHEDMARYKLRELTKKLNMETAEGVQQNSRAEAVSNHDSILLKGVTAA